ncbi:MAG: cysteine-rich CWC family protein [Burkholderiales bacterium]
MPAQSGSFDQPCWCTQATFSAELLARVPPEQGQQSCICPSCAAKPAQGRPRLIVQNKKPLSSRSFCSTRPCPSPPFMFAMPRWMTCLHSAACLMLTVSFINSRQI